MVYQQPWENFRLLNSQVLTVVLLFATMSAIPELVKLPRGDGGAALYLLFVRIGAAPRNINSPLTVHCRSRVPQKTVSIF